MEWLASYRRRNGLCITLPQRVSRARRRLRRRRLARRVNRRGGTDGSRRAGRLTTGVIGW